MGNNVDGVKKKRNRSGMLELVHQYNKHMGGVDL